MQVEGQQVWTRLSGRVELLMAEMVKPKVQGNGRPTVQMVKVSCGRSRYSKLEKFEDSAKFVSLEMIVTTTALCLQTVFTASNCIIDRRGYGEGCILTIGRRQDKLCSVITLRAHKSMDGQR
ncbi:hypothetical protein GOP47_0003016 [Adiantum capillus-veneris]|uniref:Uncharacterized protein n=1 Tax=Adiantum capillus-veneris TaxID=13818 RepID=A0A9D4ZPQ1_ADICA|nr:hypothetical protein GOP47_0003016 [Adiantum capillus-veneris]